jgi:uncharacterized protein YkwD
MEHIKVHCITRGLAKITVSAICLLILSTLPAKQLYSQSIENEPTEQSLPAAWTNGTFAEPAFVSAASNTANSGDMRARSFVPMVIGGSKQAPTAEPIRISDPQQYVNAFRRTAGVPAVTFDQTLNDNCWLHARYMAEENEITHDERVGSPWYTPAGQSCGQKGNAWLGSEFNRAYWQPYHAIESWVASVGHRMWLLYPTTPVFGYGFYTANNNRAGAALDVLTRVNMGKDTSYAGWPVRYPAPDQTGIPAQAYSITLGWRYFGATPTVSSVSLSVNGSPIPHTYSTSLPVGHKGIEIKPSQPFPPNSTIAVSVAGTYDGKPFNYAWSFKTGS